MSQWQYYCCHCDNSLKAVNLPTPIDLTLSFFAAKSDIIL
jgi:hypothetical protein